ncbi:MAG: CHAT domain-containing protein [Magnetococcales bacterium]|nr:CHAT domain-containing protein [Magnetococcales bacterium]
MARTSLAVEVAPGETVSQRVATLTTLAATQQSMGYYPEAKKILDQAQLLVASGDSTDHARLLAAWGDWLLNSHQEDEALKKLQEGVGLLDQQTEGRQVRLLKGQLLNNMGNVYVVQKRYGLAHASYLKALQAISGLEVRLLESEIHHNQARLAMRKRDFSQAVDQIELATASYRAVPDHVARGFGLVSLGRILLDIMRADTVASDQYLLQAWNLLEEGGNLARLAGDGRTLSFALGYQGQSYEMGGRTGEAIQLTKQALFHAHSVQASDSLYLWQWQMGRLLARQGMTASALQHYRDAITTLKGVRQDFFYGMRDAPDSFRELIGPVYYQLADLLLRQVDAAASREDKKALLVETRDTIEVLKAAELQNLFQDECVTAMQSRTAGVEQLGHGTAVFYPILLEDRVELLLTMPDGEMKRHTTAVGRAKVEQTAQALRIELEEEIDGQEFLPHAKNLYRWLIAPVMADLKEASIHTLIVVPDGLLRQIPMASLHDGNRYLVEHMAIGVTPSLRLTDPQPLRAIQSELMISALSEQVDNDFPPLPSVLEEVDKIKRIYNNRTIINDEFTTNNVMDILDKKSYSIVHIASHGQFNRDPRKTFLLTYDGKLTMNHLEKMISASQSRHEAVELLTLSACQTAAGDDRAALGLAGVAVKAGARSVLASLWTIDDQATAQLVTGFYHNLRSGIWTKAQALQQAQIVLLKQRGTKHPSFWSAFIMIGNWL